MNLETIPKGYERFLWEDFTITPNVKQVDIVIHSEEKQTYDHDGMQLWRQPTAIEMQIDLKAIKQAFDDGEQTLTDQIETLRKKLIDDAVNGIIKLEPAEYHTLVVDASKADKKKLRDELQQIYDKGRQLVVNELEDQGAEDVDNLFDVPDEDEESLDTIGEVTAARVSNDVQSRVIGIAANLAALGVLGLALKKRLAQALEGASTAYVGSAAATADHAALGLGRAATAEANANIIKEVYYSSVLDEGTCIPCQDADGKTGANDSEIPQAPNPDCEGRGRCRCIHVYVLNTEQTKGGEGSGNFDHEGRPGMVGGSAPSGGAAEITIDPEIARRLSLVSNLNESVVYHGTTEQALNRIKIDGLEPVFAGQNFPQDMYIGDRKASVYLTNSPDTAAYYARQAKTKIKEKFGVDSKPVIIKFVVPRERFSQFIADRHDPSSVYTTKTIPPQWIQSYWVAKARAIAIYGVLLVDGIDEQKGGSGSGNYGHRGRPGLVGGSSESVARSARAKRSYNPVTKAKRAIATKHESKIAELIGGEFTGDNRPFDVTTDTHGIEVKTVLPGVRNAKITMHPESLARKEKEARSKGYKTATVVIDARQDRAQYYFRNGLGSFRLSSMEKISPNDLAEKLK